MPEYTIAQVRQHASRTDCWITIRGVVYDVTKFIDMHPGGAHVLLQHAGEDATDVFELFHAPKVLEKYSERLRVGTLRGYTDRMESRPVLRNKASFGDQIPYADPIWYQRFNSPYYKDTHIKFRERVRRFVDTEVIPTMDEWKDSARPPKDLLLKMGKEGFLACMVGPPFPIQYVDPGVEAPEDFDHFHEMIAYDEFGRCGSSAVVAALTNGPSIALSAVHRFGTESQKQRVARDVLMGRKMIALAISEPGAGTDVAGLTTIGVRQGDKFIVNGCKKWITNGTYSDYFVTAVVTQQSKGARGGMSLMLVDRDSPGFSVRKIKIRGSDLSGTSYLDFDNVPVPVENLIGTEGDGFKHIMHNFNHERMYVNVLMCRLSRVCLEESVKFAMKRKTFGKYLHEHQDIRMRIAAMVQSIESLWSWLEYITYQMNTMSHDEAMENLGDVISLAKAHAARVYEQVANETTMIFGGNALYQGGVGEKIEPALLTTKFYTIPAGSVNMMMDYGAKSLFRLANRVAKL